MNAHSVRRILLVACLPILLPASTAGQVESLEAEAEALIRAAYAAWDAGNVDAIVDGAEGLTAGFGFRTLAPRGTQELPAAALKAGLQAFFDSLEYYDLAIDEIHLAQHDDVVVAWGFHTEDFQHRGSEPERVRVRFTATLKQTADGELRTILTHRDIQAFGDNDRYISRPSGGR